MTFKFVGALEGITNPNPTSTKLLLLGLGIGLVTEVLRKVIKASANYKKFRDSGKQGFVFDFVLDAFLLPSPYASSYGGFVGFTTALWFGGGGVLGSSLNAAGDYMRKRTVDAKKSAATPGEGDELPEDMSTVSLVGGGLIAGESPTDELESRVNRRARPLDARSRAHQLASRRRFESTRPAARWASGWSWHARGRKETAPPRSGHRARS